jgi:hypothetical protein
MSHLVKNVGARFFEGGPCPTCQVSSSYEYQKNGTYKKWDYMRHKNHNTHLQKTPKMAEPRPYDPLLHGFIWPLLGQKSSHKKCYQTEILATSARVIWPRPSHQISQKNCRICFGGGGSLVTINNGGLSIADEISFFQIFKYI